MGCELDNRAIRVNEERAQDVNLDVGVNVHYRWDQDSSSCGQNGNRTSAFTGSDWGDAGLA